MPLHDVARGNPDTDPSYPGYRIGYDQITSAVTIASTTEASGTTIITGSTYTFDGGLVRAEFFSPLVRTGTTAASQVVVSLFESSTQIGRFSLTQSSSAAIGGGPVLAVIYFTPTAGTHAYTVTAISTTSTTGSPIVGAGSGGTAGSAPAYLAFFKA